MNLFNKKIGLYDGVLFAFLLGIYYYMTFKVADDIALHASIITSYIDGNEGFPTNFLYYATVYAFSFFSPNMVSLLISSFILLSIFTFFKYYIVKDIYLDEVYGKEQNNYFSIKMASFASTVLMFTFSLPSLVIFYRYYYVGNYPANIWHNSTTIFTMPFVVLLFWLSQKQLVESNIKRLFFITLLILLNAVSKPSFLFVYLLVYPIMLLKKYNFYKQFWINVIPLFIGSLVVVFEYYLIYINNISTDKTSSVSINFFYALDSRYAHGNYFLLIIIFLSTLVSGYLFPAVLLIKQKVLLRVPMVQFAILNCIVALILSQTLVETGHRMNHGNFYWQVFMCTFLLFFVCVLQLLKLIKNHDLNWKAYKIELSVLFLHLMAGILYFVKILVFGGCY